MTEWIKELIEKYTKIIENKGDTHYNEIYEFLWELDDEDEKEYGDKITILHNNFFAFYNLN